MDVDLELYLGVQQTSILLMTEETMKFIDILEAKSIYQEGKNITKYLREKLDSTGNTSDIIEIAYELQTGSYIDDFNSKPQSYEMYTKDLSEILNSYLISGDSLLDIGAGEFTTLSLVLNKIDVPLSNVLALDVSWSRLQKGSEFHAKYSKTPVLVEPIVADFKEIPLHSNCVDIVCSSHALEPNGNDLSKILAELFRVTKKKLILFEPSYELNSKQGRERMDKLGYVKDIEGEAAKLGGRVLDIIPITNRITPLNPTACYVIEPPSLKLEHLEFTAFCVPGTDFRLKIDGQFLFSKDTGLAFPILEEIPILKTKSAVLATLKC